MNEAYESYKNLMLIRLDKDGIIPYLSASDFDGLTVVNGEFLNRDGVKIRYFRYKKHDDCKKTVLFLPGVAPGHTAYITEINELCEMGFKVLTLDYYGCGESEGADRCSINEPTLEVLDLLHVTGETVCAVVGHSLGGYTALNVLNLRREIKKGVIISGFFSPRCLRKYLKCKSEEVDGFEKVDILPKMQGNIDFLKETEDKILFIHSVDDEIIYYDESTQYIKENVKNANLTFFITDRHKHNPTYRVEGVEYAAAVFGEYDSLCRSGKLATYEDKKAYMQDKSAKKMTEQDEKVRSVIAEFLKN